MESSVDFEKDLIAVLLVVESVNDKNKLLYKYEQINADRRLPDPISFHSPYAIVIAKDFDPPGAKDDDAPRTTFRNFDETTLSILTSPNACGTHVEVQVDDVVLVGHTLGLEKNKNLKSFAIFFALRATAKASIIVSYQEMSKRVGTAIRCEEQRASYLTGEYAKLTWVLQQRDGAAEDPLLRIQHEEDRVRQREARDRMTEQAYVSMVEQSGLAKTLKQIYIDLQSAGEINLTVNQWLNISCCLPHRSIAMNCSLAIDFAFDVLSNAEEYFKSYYGLLLLVEPSALIASLPTDSSSTLSTLVRSLRSWYAMSRLSIETTLPLAQIYHLAAHLLYWGRAKIIYPINDDNIYVISPDADISKSGAQSQLWKETFQNTANYRTLQEVLAEFSDAVTFFDHMPQNDETDTGGRIKYVEWLLRHRLIVQLHYYYYLLLPNDDRAEFKEEYKRTRLPRPRAPIRRQQYSSDIFGSSSKCERFCMTSENIDIRGNVLSINGFEYPMASSPMTNTLSYSSAHNSKSTDTLRTTTGMSSDDVFPPSSLASSLTMNTDRSPLFYLPQVMKALPGERYELQQRLAMAIKDVKAQDVTDFLKIADCLNGRFHLEEIMSLKSLTRSQVLTIIEKFQSMVVRALHQDPNPILQI